MMPRRRHPNDIVSLLPARLKESHKRTFGHALLIAGSNKYTGAAALMTEAALRSGVGLVTIICTHLTAQVIRLRCPEAIVIEAPEDDGVIEKSTIQVIKDQLSTNMFSAIGIGPGIGVVKNEDEFFNALVTTINAYQIPLLVDAEAMPPIYKILLKKDVTMADVVFTPHPKEFLRMLDCDSISDINKDVMQAAKVISQTIVYKTHSTIIGSSKGVWQSSTGNQSLATAGAGDVLAGVVTGMLAQGMSAYDAAILSVYLHGLAGEIASANLGMRSVLARDLCDAISTAFQSLEGDLNG